MDVDVAVADPLARVRAIDPALLDPACYTRTRRSALRPPTQRNDVYVPPAVSVHPPSRGVSVFDSAELHGLESNGFFYYYS